MKTNRTVVGVDTAKWVFHLYWDDMDPGKVMQLQLTRAGFLEHFANLRRQCAPCTRIRCSPGYFARRVLVDDAQPGRAECLTGRGELISETLNGHEAGNGGDSQGRS